MEGKGEKERERHGSILHEREREEGGQSPAAFTVAAAAAAARCVCGSIAGSRAGWGRNETRRNATQRQTSEKETTNSPRLGNSTNPFRSSLSSSSPSLPSPPLSLRISKTMTTCST